MYMLDDALREMRISASVDLGTSRVLSDGMWSGVVDRWRRRIRKGHASFGRKEQCKMLAASGMPEVLGAVRFSSIWEGQTRFSRSKLTSFDT